MKKRLLVTTATTSTRNHFELYSSRCLHNAFELSACGSVSRTNITIKSAKQIKVGKPLLGMNRDIDVDLEKKKKSCAKNSSL